jgi:5-hydroxyisourate hydrolase-like protein (transthyretin family)
VQAVKRATIAAWLLLLVTARASFCSVMVNGPPTKASRNIVVTTLFEGKPRKGVRVEIYRCHKQAEANPSFSLITGEDGTVAAPTLSPGVYRIVASADLNLIADLDLRVSSHSKEKTSSFSMELVASRFPTWEQQLAAAEQLPVKDRVQNFSGVVRDPSGAAIKDVSIEIIRKGGQGKERVARLKSDGRFSTELAEGAYIAVFAAQGFGTQLLPFEVSKTQGGGDLRVRLEPGATT